MSEITEARRQYTAKDIEALLQWLDAINDPEQEAIPSLEDADWRTRAGIITAIIRQLQPPESITAESVVKAIRQCMGRHFPVSAAKSAGEPRARKVERCPNCGSEVRSDFDVDEGVFCKCTNPECDYGYTANDVPPAAPDGKGAEDGK